MADDEWSRRKMFSCLRMTGTLIVHSLFNLLHFPDHIVPIRPGCPSVVASVCCGRLHFTCVVSWLLAVKSWNEECEKEVGSSRIGPKGPLVFGNSACHCATMTRRKRNRLPTADKACRFVYQESCSTPSPPFLHFPVMGIVPKDNCNGLRCFVQGATTSVLVVKDDRGSPQRGFNEK